MIQKFAAKETEFSEARNNYTYRQTVKLQELDAGGNPTGGEWNLVEDIIFSPEGKRMEKVVYAPVPTLRQILLTPEDEQDLRNVQPFVLTTAEIPDYDIDYLGREKVDEIGCYTFAVKPKKLAPGKRYFEGQIWVDDRDLQIVKTYGKGVGELKHGSSKDKQFPQVRDLPRADRRQVLVPHLHARRRHAALQGRQRAHPHDREVPGLQAVRGTVHHQVRRRGERQRRSGAPAQPSAGKKK